jgi:hypothetical protein
MTPAPGATTIVPSSPASRPSPPGGLRPALTPTAGDTGMHRSGAGNKEDQQNKIHLTEVSTVSGDCQGVIPASSRYFKAGISSVCWTARETLSLCRSSQGPCAEGR